MYPKPPTVTMKNIATRVMAKTICFNAFLNSFVNKGIVKHEDIYIFCLTFDNQDEWGSSGFNARSFSYLNEEFSKGKPLVFDDMQSDTKGKKLVET